MKRTMNRLISFVMALIAVFSIISVTTTGVSAATANAPGFPWKTYTLNSSGRVYGWNNESLSGSSCCWIDCATDECTIRGVSSDGKKLYVQFPTSSGTLTRWFKASDFTMGNVKSALTVKTSTKCITTYKRASGSATYGYTGNGDPIYILGTSGSFTQILYELSAGGYKMAFAYSSDIRNYTKGDDGLVDVTSSFKGKQVRIRSVQNWKYLSADENEPYIPALCNRDTAGSWETFTVSVTSDGWAGFKAHNGKWLCANNSVTNTPVQAISDNLQSWECFKIYKKGSDYFIKAQVNYKFLCAKVETKNVPVHSVSSEAKGWERFQIEIVQNQPSFVHPMNDYKISRPFSCYVSGNARPSHLAIDYCPNGTDTDSNVYAFSAGTVVDCGWNNANGNYVVISHTISNQTVYSFYGHLNSYGVKINQAVSAGTKIGVVGKTGSASNNVVHLHFSVVDQKKPGNYWGYATYFTGDKVNYSDVMYYNPGYIIKYGKLP